MAIGLWAGIASGGLALGPVIGGLVLAHFSWGAVFLVNLPVVAAAFALTLWQVPRHPTAGAASWDLAGSLLVMAGLFCLVFAIKACAHRPLSLPTLGAALALGVAFFLLFARQQRGRTQRLIDFSLFRLPGFPAAVAGAGLGTAGIVGLELVLGQHLQLVLGFSPLQAGLIILPAPLGSLLAGLVTGRVLRHRAASRVGAGGLLLSAVAALCLTALPFDAGLTPLLTVLLVLTGAGVGTAATAAASAIMSSAPPERSGMAASLEEVSFELGGTLGVALFGSLMTIVYVTGMLPQASASLDDALRLADQLPAEPGTALRAAGRQAFTRAFEVVVLGAALLWATTATCMWRSRR